MRVQKKKFGFMSVFALVAAIFTGCGPGMGGDSALPDAGAGNALIDIPVQDTSFYSDLKAHTLFGSEQVSADGMVPVNFAGTEGIRFAFVTHADNTAPILYSYYFPSSVQSDVLAEFIDDGNGLRANVRTTALSMVMVNPLLMDATIEQKAMIAEEAVADPGFEILVREIESHKILNPLEPINYETTPDLFYHSSKLTITSMRRIADRLPDQQPAGFVAQGETPPGVDTDMAYPVIEGSSITTVNPRMNYYAIAWKDAQVANWSDGVEGVDWGVNFVPGKERVLDISIFPPKIATVPPVERHAFGVPQNPSYIYIYKGFQFDMSRQELENTPPAKLALTANTWATFIMMIALVGDVSNMVPYVGGVLPLMIDEVTEAASFENVYDAVQKRDRTNTIVSIEDLFRELGPAMENHFTAVVDEGFSLNNIMTLIQGVMGLITGGSVVNMIIDITTQQIPFYYDLFTSHSSAIYPVFDKSFQPLPNNPIISRVLPEQPMNGRPIYINGYGFGSDQADSKLYINDIPVEAENIGDWTNSQIIARVPFDTAGEGANTATGEQIRVQVENDAGERTNELARAYLFNPDAEAGGEGGGEGGGCAAMPVSAGMQLDWALQMLLLAGAVFFVRRRLQPAM